MNTLIHIAPSEPVSGAGTAESPYRSTNIDFALERGQPIVLRHGEHYTTAGCAHNYYDTVRIEGNCATLEMHRPDWGTRADVGVIRCNYAEINDLVIHGASDPAPGNYIKEGIFARRYGRISNVAVMGLTSNVEAGMESFGILLHGDGSVDNCDVYGGAKNNPYSVGIYAGVTYNTNRVRITNCRALNTSIAFGGNNKVTFRDCYGMNNDYAFYTDTGAMRDWTAVECEFDGLKYAAFSVIGQQAVNVKMRECIFNFAQEATANLFVVLTGNADNLQFYRNTVRGQSITLVSATKLPLGLALEDNLLLAASVRHNIRASDSATASPQHLNTLLLRGNRGPGNTLVTAATISTEGATEK